MAEVCTQIYELFTYDPKKSLSPEEEERLTDISHAYGLLLYHYKKQHHTTLEVSAVQYPHTIIAFIDKPYIS